MLNYAIKNNVLCASNTTRQWMATLSDEDIMPQSFADAHCSSAVQ